MDPFMPRQLDPLDISWPHNQKISPRLSRLKAHILVEVRFIRGYAIVSSGRKPREFLSGINYNTLFMFINRTTYVAYANIHFICIPNLQLWYDEGCISILQFHHPFLYHSVNRTQFRSFWSCSFATVVMV